MQSIKRFLCCCCSSPSSDVLFENAEEFYRTYQVTKKSQDLKKAIDTYSASLVARRKEGNPDTAHILVNYATALWARYEQDQTRSDVLKKVIELCEDALAQWSNAKRKPEGFADLLLNLGNAYHSQSQAVVTVSQEEARNALNKAISFLEELNTGSYPTADPAVQAKRLIMLGSALNRRCGQEKSTERLDDAIYYLERGSGILDSEALTKEMPQDEMLGRVRFLCYDNLATAFYTRYRYHQPTNPRAQDLNNAINYSKRAIAVLPANDPNRGTSLYNLANQLYKRYEQANSQKKSGDHLVANNLDLMEDSQDLEDAFKSGKEAEKLLENTGYFEQVGALLNVIQAHMDHMSKQSSRNASRAPTPNGGEELLPDKETRQGQRGRRTAD